jgi:hypothetical protein
MIQEAGKLPVPREGKASQGSSNTVRSGVQGAEPPAGVPKGCPL